MTVEEMTPVEQPGREISDANAAGDAGSSITGEAPAPTSAANQAAVTAENRRLMRLTSVSGLQLIKSPSKAFEVLSDSKDEVSETVPSHLSFKKGIDLPVLGRILWKDLKRDTWQWLKNPLHLALLVWLVGVSVSGALLFMIMVGMLDAVIPSKAHRDDWFEVNNQIINGLFTLMCVLVHPGRVRDAVRLYVWTPKHILIMRTEFCKDGKRKPQEWKHMVIVVALLNGNCVFQYCLAGWNWGYTHAARPPVGVGAFLALAIGCAAGSGLYQMLSPLGRDYALVTDDRVELAAKTVKPKFGGWLERSKSFAVSSQVVANPEWVGDVVCGACINRRTAVLSCLCPLCVHGINQERLGFGNKYVHMVTFAFFLVAPFLIFDLAAINIINWNMKRAIGATGIGLSILGVLYGGYWRIMMRKTYGLPRSRWCCNNSVATDLATWLFCSCCALCQEVRTAESYEITDAHFFDKDGLHAVAEEVEGLETIESDRVGEEAVGEGAEQEMVAPRMLEMGGGGGETVKDTTVRFREDGMAKDGEFRGDDSIV